MSDYEDVALKYLDVTLRSGDEWMAKCLVHEDSSASLQFNVKSGLWVCFSCGAKGNAKTLLRLVGGTYREPEIEVADIYAKLDAIDAAVNRPRTASVLPEHTLRRYRVPTAYWDSRGVSRAMQDVFDLGYDFLTDEAIIPVRNVRGGLLGVIRRRMLAKGEFGPKYMYYKGFPRKTSLFASWLVAKSSTDHVVMNEGSMDSVAVWQAGHPALGQYGSSLSREQVVLLRRLGVTKVTLFYDNDAAGREATLSAIPLLRDFLVYVVRYRKGDPKDPGACSTDRVSELIKSAKLLL